MDFQKQEEKILAWAKDLGLTEERKITTKKPLHNNKLYQDVDFRNIKLFIFFEPDTPENILRFAVVAKDTTPKMAKKNFFGDRKIKDNEQCYKVKFLHNQKIYSGENVYKRNQHTFYDSNKENKFNFSYQLDYSLPREYQPKSDFYKYSQVRLIFQYLNRALATASLNPINYENLMNIEQEFIDMQKNKILNELEFVHF